MFIPGYVNLYNIVYVKIKTVCLSPVVLSFYLFHNIKKYFFPINILFKN